MVHVFKNGLGGVVYSPNGLFEFMDWTKKELAENLKDAKTILDVQEMKSIPAIQQYIKTGKGLAYYGTENADEVVKEKSSYLQSEKLAELTSKFDKKIENVDASALNQKKTILFNDREIGNFSFDLASLGLIPVVEYYSPLKKYVVNPNYVKSRLVDGKREFYHIALPYIREHVLKEMGAKLYSDILGRYVEQNDAEPGVDDKGNVIFIFSEKMAIPEHVVIQRQVLLPNGKPKYTSTWKKSFIYIENKPFELPQIDLIINSSFNWKIDAITQMVYTTLPVIGIIKKLQELNVKNRFFLIKTSNGYKGKKVYNDILCTSIVKLKGVNEAPDFNKLAIVSSDARYYRLEGHLSTRAIFNALGVVSYCHRSGVPINDEKISIKDFNKAIRETKDYGDADPKYFEGGNSENKIFFPRCLNMQEAEDAYNEILAKINTMLKRK